MLCVSVGSEGLNAASRGEVGGHGSGSDEQKHETKGPTYRDEEQDKEDSCRVPDGLDDRIHCVAPVRLDKDLKEGHHGAGHGLEAGAVAAVGLKVALIAPGYCMHARMPSR